MWDCVLCGCKAIAASIDFCPHCQKPKPPEAVGTPAEEEPEVTKDTPNAKGAKKEGWDAKN